MCWVSSFRKRQRGVPAPQDPGDHREVDTLFIVWGVQELFTEPWAEKGFLGGSVWTWG